MSRWRAPVSAEAVSGSVHAAGSRGISAMRNGEWRASVENVREMFEASSSAATTYGGNSVEGMFARDSQRGRLYTGTIEPSGATAFESIRDHRLNIRVVRCAVQRRDIQRRPSTDFQVTLPQAV